MESMNQAYPSGIYSGSQQNLPVICLPVPAFSVRYLLQQEGLPLGCFTQIVGKPASCKSSLLYEILGWHMNFPGGGGVLIETEGKISPELPYSIFGYNHPRFRLQPCKTLQEWNAALKDWIEKFISYMDGDSLKQNPGAGRTMPIGFGVDTLMAALPAQIFEKLRDNGSPTKHFSDTATRLDEYLKWLTQKIKDMPFSVVGVNYLKPGRTGNERNIAGGWAPKSHAALELEVSRLTSSKPGNAINRVLDDEMGLRLRIEAHKNTMASPAAVEVEMLWYMDYEDRDPLGHYRQKTFFDWHSASIELLLALTRGDGERAKRIRSIIDLQANADTRRVGCKELGISATAKAPYRDAGLALEAKIKNDKAFETDLYAAVGILRRSLFKQDVEYCEQCQDAMDLSLKAERQATVSSPWQRDPLSLLRVGSGGIRIN